MKLIAVLVGILISIIGVCNTTLEAPASFEGYSIDRVDNANEIIEISASLTFNVSGQATIQTMLTNSLLSKANQNENVKQLTHSGFAGETFSFTTQLELSGSGYHRVDFNIFVEHALPRQYTNAITFPIYFESKDGEVTSHSFLHPDSAYTRPTIIVNSSPDKSKPVARFVSITETNITDHSEVNQVLLDDFYINIQISGQIEYLNSAVGYQGIPDVGVYLDWDYDNNSSTGYTPYDGQGLLHVEYDITDMDGHFSFSFTFVSTQPANYYSDVIRVYANATNSATFDGDQGNGARFPNYNYIDISSATTSIIADGSINDIDVYDGGALRYFHRAREFAIQDLNYTPNQIRYYIDLSEANSFFCQPGNCGGMNLNVPRIVFNHLPYTNQVTAHEYGHFLEYQLVGFIPNTGWSGSHWFELETNHTLAWVEGWAEFYAAACYTFWYSIELPAAWESYGNSTKYQFLEYSQNFLNSADDWTEVEGAVACFFFALWDGVGLRSPGYSGDNDDIELTGNFILDHLDQRYDIQGSLLGVHTLSPIMKQ